MDRGMAPRRQERSRRGDAVTARLVRTLPVAAAAASSTSSWNNPWLVENWGLIIMAAMTVATVAFSTGTSTPGTMSTSTRGGHQSLFASPTSRGGISIARAGQQPSSPWRRGRALQEGNADDVGSPIVEYETKLQLFMCNPDLAEEGSGGYLVDETSLAAALSRVTGLRQADPTEIIVAIKTEPVDADDDSYMCDVDGMLQWHAQIKYGAADSLASGTTPAVMAAHANDYVAYSGAEFKTILAGYINDEYAGEAETVELSSDDIVVPTVGWIVTFPEEESVAQDTATAGSSDGLAMGLKGDSGLWVWWVWLIYALLVACCLVPLCCLLCRRRADAKYQNRERQAAAAAAAAAAATTRKDRGEEGLSKIRGPEWGITELDFEGDHNAYQDQEMKHEYARAGKDVAPTSYKQSHRAGQQSASTQAWAQEVGKKSEWAPTSSGDPSWQSSGQTSTVRRFDIDDDDADEGEGTLGNKRPHYSFDVGLRRAAGPSRGGRESKS